MTRNFGDFINGQARVVIMPIKGGRVAVVRYLPPGADIAPEVYGRFSTVAEAMPAFEQASRDVIKMGYAALEGQ